MGVVGNNANAPRAGCRCAGKRAQVSGPPHVVGGIDVVDCVHCKKCHGEAFGIVAAVSLLQALDLQPRPQNNGCRPSPLRQPQQAQQAQLLRALQGWEVKEAVKEDGPCHHQAAPRQHHACTAASATPCCSSTHIDLTCIMAWNAPPPRALAQSTTTARNRKRAHTSRLSQSATAKDTRKDLSSDMVAAGWQCDGARPVVPPRTSIPTAEGVKGLPNTRRSRVGSRC